MNPTDYIIEREGGWQFTRNVHDRGGATYAGVTLGTMNRWRRGRGHSELTADDYEARAATGALNDDVRTIYADRYVKPFEGLPDQVRLMAIDAAVMSGVERSAKMLQTALCSVGDRIGVDGIVGRRTRGAAAAAAERGRLHAALARFSHNRATFYADIVKRDATQMRFLGGWINRTFDTLVACLETREG